MKTGTGVGNLLPGGGESGLNVVKEAAENDSQVTEDLAKKAHDDFSDEDEREDEEDLHRSPMKVDLSTIEI